MKTITYVVLTLFNILLSILAGWAMSLNTNVLIGIIIFILALASLQSRLTMISVNT